MRHLKQLFLMIIYIADGYSLRIVDISMLTQ